MKIPVEWLNSYLEKPLPASKMADMIEQAGVEVDAVGSNDVIDATTAANRWDLNGIVWLAHEVAAHAGQKVTFRETEHKTGSGSQRSHKKYIGTVNSKLAQRYILAHVEVDIERKTPGWMSQRLVDAGIRPINIVVDITNYTMVELSQPLHAFDAAKIELPIGVRAARTGEQLVTLDGVERDLDSSDLLIADKRGPIGLAGVMGGQGSEVSATTAAIYLEAACFNGSRLRQTAKRHGLRTDASARFERQLPVRAAGLGMTRALGLLKEFAGAKLIAGPFDTHPAVALPAAVVVRPARISGLLGIPVTAASLKKELPKLGFSVESKGENQLITVPWSRPDVNTPEDIAEEVVKLVGYASIPATIPAWQPTAVEFDNVWAPRWRAKAVLQSLSLFEVVTYSFISQSQIEALGREPKNALKLKNPLSSEQAYLRTDLLPSLLRTAALNRTYSRQFGLYEFSKVYRATEAGKLPEEPMRLGVLVRAQSNSYRQVKAVLDRLSRVFGVEAEVRTSDVEPQALYPRRHGKVFAGSTDIGRIAQLSPAVVAATKLGGEVGYLELDWEAFLAASSSAQHQPESSFPAVSRDLSLVIDRTISWQQIKNELKGESVAFVSDYYGGDLDVSEKVMTIRLHFSASDHTLTDAEADKRLQAIFARLQKQFGAQLQN